MQKFFEGVLLLLMLFAALWLGERFFSCGNSGEPYRSQPVIDLFPTIPPRLPDNFHR